VQVGDHFRAGVHRERVPDDRHTAFQAAADDEILVGRDLSLDEYRRADLRGSFHVTPSSYDRDGPEFAITVPLPPIES
jgi:hypothetical protein